jgi:hypothetical protein
MGAKSAEGDAEGTGDTGQAESRFHEELRKAWRALALKRRRA